MSSSSSFVVSPEERDEYNDFLFTSTGSSNDSQKYISTVLTPQIRFRLKTRSEIKFKYEQRKHEERMRDLERMIEQFKLTKAWKFPPLKKWTS
uniref:PX domain-containing protein n=1 Tax=Steinernema glaseri TaxID=37863 RepID=A0A1I7ZX03_9BILA